MGSKTKGFQYALCSVALFAAQDGLSKYLAAVYPPVFIIMIRYWAFAVLVLIASIRSAGGIRGVIYTKHPLLHALRGFLLVAEILLFVISLTRAGLAMTQAIFQIAPILVTALSGPLLKEAVGMRRWAAVATGMTGVLIILNPNKAEFNTYLLLPLASAVVFAIYSIATRRVSFNDTAQTNHFYAGIIGAVIISFIGPFYWTSIAITDLPFLAALCVCGTLSHYFLIRAYGLLQASEVQPITYLQLVLGVGIAMCFFNESITWRMVVGAVTVIAAGAFVVFTEQKSEAAGSGTGRATTF